MSDDRSRDGAHPGDTNHIPLYLGPYEAWNFGVGQPYALPVMRNYRKYISALAELGLPTQASQAIRAMAQHGWLPTLWKGLTQPTFFPFVVSNPFDRLPNAEQLQDILRAGFSDATRDFITSATPAASETAKPMDMWVDRIPGSRFRVAFPVTDAAMHPDIPRQPSSPAWKPDSKLRERIGKEKEITVLAVIDDGLPFAHRNFRDKSGRRSRVEFCWLQSVTADRRQKSVLFGREYSREQIEDLIAQHGDDEDKLYRKAGATLDTEDLGHFIDRHATHGAHVMDLAAGYAPERARQAYDQNPQEEEPREEIRIIAVQLPNTIAWDTSGFGKDMYMLSAFHYIFDRADIIAEGYKVKNLRLVINFSYGFSGGRHDGETELEAAINELVCKRRTRAARNNDDLFGPSPTALVLPAGNTFLSRLHGLITRDDFVNNAATLHWRVQPNDRTPSYLELWFWHGFNPNGYRIELQDPWGKLQSSFNIVVNPTTRPGADPNKFDIIKNSAQQQVGQISVDLHRADAASGPGTTGRYRVLIVLAPTEPEDPTLPRADAGKWTIVIRRGVAALIEDPIHCWIQRSADPEGLRSGSRQSYFDDDAYEDIAFTPEGDFSEQDGKPPRGDRKTFVRHFGSLNGLATGRTALVVGGYRLVGGLGTSPARVRPALYSSAGVLPDPETTEAPELTPCSAERPDHRTWPKKQVNASSMSDRSRVLPGTIAAGVRSGSLSFVQGTSAAAPFVARRLAETFTTATEEDVQKAQASNYLCLLGDHEPEQETTNATSSGLPELKARLGDVIVSPHWQPGGGPE